MSHDIIYYGHETLKKKAECIDTFNKELVELVDEMFHTMGKAKGLGLAAPQIDILKKIITIDTSHRGNGDKIALVNPEITETSDNIVIYEEGCLSVPGLYAEVNRPSAIKVSGYAPNGKKVEFKADGLFARVLQHEIDHLDGILFIDRLEDYIKKELNVELKKIRKLNK